MSRHNCTRSNKKWIIERDGNMCSDPFGVCHMRKANAKFGGFFQPDVDHIIEAAGNKSLCKKLGTENGRTLCANCHSFRTNQARAFKKNHSDEYDQFKSLLERLVLNPNCQIKKWLTEIDKTMCAIFNHEKFGVVNDIYRTVITVYPFAMSVWNCRNLKYGLPNRYIIEDYTIEKLLIWFSGLETVGATNDPSNFIEHFLSTFSDDIWTPDPYQETDEYRRIDAGWMEDRDAHIIAKDMIRKRIKKIMTEYNKKPIPLFAQARLEYYKEFLRHLNCPDVDLNNPHSAYFEKLQSATYSKAKAYMETFVPDCLDPKHELSTKLTYFVTDR